MKKIGDRIAVRHYLFLIFVMAAPLSAAQEPIPPINADAAHLMWAAFSCGEFSTRSGKAAEDQERLFHIGYRAGKAFIDGVRAGEISETEIQNAPVGVLMYMGGPSTDFAIGRIYESATSHAYDRVVKQNVQGLVINDPAKWAYGERVVDHAEIQYRQQNCAILR